MYSFPLQARPLLFVFVKLSEIAGISCLAQSCFHAFITYFFERFYEKRKIVPIPLYLTLKESEWVGGKRGAGVRGPGVRGVENAGSHFFRQNMNFPH